MILLQRLDVLLPKENEEGEGGKGNIAARQINHPLILIISTHNIVKPTFLNVSPALYNISLHLTSYQRKPGRGKVEKGKYHCH